MEDLILIAFIIATVAMVLAIIIILLNLIRETKKVDIEIQENNISSTEEQPARNQNENIVITINEWK
jgi:hypothetical protein